MKYGFVFQRVKLNALDDSSWAIHDGFRHLIYLIGVLSKSRSFN